MANPNSYEGDIFRHACAAGVLCFVDLFLVVSVLALLFFIAEQQSSFTFSLLVEAVEAEFHRWIPVIMDFWYLIVGACIFNVFSYYRYSKGWLEKGVYQEKRNEIRRTYLGLTVVAVLTIALWFIMAQAAISLEIQHFLLRWEPLLLVLLSVSALVYFSLKRRNLW